MEEVALNTGVWAGTGHKHRGLSQAEVQNLLADALSRVDLRGKRVLVILPDSTRSAPISLIFRLLKELLGQHVAALDHLIALGTHRAMDDSALSDLLGVTVQEGLAGSSHIFNHQWEDPETFVTLGTIPAADIEQITEKRLSLDVPVRLNRKILDYDQLLVCGPVFPHEVIGFSGGNKYFFPGIAGPEIINITHWLGALMTSMAVIGKMDTPVRQVVDRAASFIPTPRLSISLVMHGDCLHGLYIGSMQHAWRAAAQLSAKLDIVQVDQPFQRVLSIVPEMYDDLWTGAKGMYKMEAVVADGGEVIIYAPHIDEISYTHGKVIDQVGYHVRDYFVKQWDRFKHFPWGVLAHSTHLRGVGTFENGVEQPRIQVTLAMNIPRQRCEKVGLGYLDPDTIDPEQWQSRQKEGILVVPRAGELLYRLK